MVREVSSSIWAHAASEIGASSRWRLFIGVLYFQGTYAERTTLGWRGRGRKLSRRRGHRELFRVGRCSLRRLVGGHVVEERCGGNEEQTSGDGCAEVEDAIVITGRAADEHVFKHLFDGAGRATVADEIGTELSMTRAAEGHVVAKDFDFPTAFFDDGEGVMGGRGLHRVSEFDVGDLGAADDFFLRFDGDLVPLIQIVKILLHDDVASTCESGIFVANKDSIGGRAAGGIFRAIHEAEEIAIVEVAEAVNFVAGRDGAFEASHDLRGELETKIHTLGADMKHQIASRGDSMARAGPNFIKGMKFSRPRRAEKTVPPIGTDAHDAGQGTFERAKTDGPQKRREIGAEGKDRGAIFVTGIDRDDEKHGGFCKRSRNEL